MNPPSPVGHTRIRRADIHDAQEIARVHVQSWQSAYRGLLPQDYLDNLDPARRLPAWRRSLLHSGWPRSGAIVAEHDEHLVGFAHFCPTRDEDRDPVTVGELASIYVLPTVWERGIGRQLMTAVLTALHDAAYTTATLWVLTTNARATRFYVSNNWRPDGTTKPLEIAGITATEARYRRALL